MPAVLHMNPDTFCVVEPGKKDPAKKEDLHPYDSIATVVVRARPQHIDIR